jgi:hypothetical protein
VTKKVLRIGGVVALANVLGFIALLATRSPEYEQLRDRDAERAAGGPEFISSADPIHLAGRPFYSSAHTPVPLIEDLYFAANVPAHLATIALGLPLASMTHRAFPGAWSAPGAWESWVLAIVFGVGSALWGFVFGATIARWAHRSASKAA